MFRSGLKLSGCLLASIAMLGVAGCADFRMPRLDPSGEHLFVDDSSPPAATCPPGTVPIAPAPAAIPAAAGGPPRVSPYSDVATMLAPSRAIGRVGSQFVMVAGVKGGDGYLRTNRRLEWSLAPGSVGQFTAIGPDSFCDFFVGDVNPPRIVSPAFAVGSTSRVPQQAGGPQCSVRTLPGQGWISVGSLVEGVSRVSVAAPDVVLPSERTQSATIYWIDAQYIFPGPAGASAGTKQPLTTTVLRQTNRAPRAGWLVRYEFVGGPQAVFGPEGTPSIEVTTNDSGQAVAEIFQKDPSPGASQVRVRVFRPADACIEKLLVRESNVVVNWTAPSLGIRQMGMAAVAIGDNITYRIEVSNPGDLTARQIVASETVPDGLTFVQSNPAATVVGNRLEWQLGDLAPRQQQTIEATFHTTRQGVVNHCVDVSGAGGLRASHCATTNVAGPLPGPAGPTTVPGTNPAPTIIPSPGMGTTPAPKAILDLTVTPGTQAVVGSNLVFALELTNRGTAPATGIVIRDTYGEGLQHQQRSPLVRPIADLAPGHSVTIGVEFRVTRPGQACQHVEATATGGIHVATDSCVTAVLPAVGGPGPATVTPPPGSPAVTPPPAVALPVLPLEIRVSGPTTATVGKMVVFTAEITNPGQRPVTNIVVSQESDAALFVTQATTGAVSKGNAWTWSIPSLPPGQTARRQVECTCKQQGSSACCRFVVTADNCQPATGQTCLDIVAANPVAPPVNPGPANPAPPPVVPGKLSVAVDNRNLVTAGKDLTFSIQVTNESGAVDNDIVVMARVPSGLAANASMVPSPDIKYQIDQGILRFSPVAALPAGAMIEYRIVVKTTAPGPISLQAAATSRRQPRAAVGDKTLSVLPAE
jgi:uncharacterized repeat protein (TIGR01451 family)